MMQIEFDGEKQAVTIDGVKVTFEALQAIVNPPASDRYEQWLRFHRIDDEVIVHVQTLPKGRDFSEFARE